MDYHIRPDVTEKTLIGVTNILAQWLPGHLPHTSLADWSFDEWVAAEWVTYWQGALPWFVVRLDEAGIEPPQPIATRLRQIADGSRRRTALMLDDAVEILSQLQAANIEALPLKGGVAAPLYFDDPLLRPLGDLDFLIHKRDVAQVSAIMESIAYTFFKKTAKDVVYLRGERDYHNIWAANNVRPVEIQHRALNEYGGIVFDMDALLWQSAETQTLWRGFTCKVPDKAALLQHICAHATEDWLLGRGKLMQLYDISTVAKQMSAQEWALLDKRLGKKGARFVYTPLAWLAQHDTNAVPAPLLAKWRHNSPPQLRAWRDQLQLGQVFERRHKNGAWHEWSVGKLLANSLADKAQVVGRLIFPPRHHFRMQAYPRLVASPVWPLAYVRLQFDRALQLAGKTLNG